MGESQFEEFLAFHLYFTHDVIRGYLIPFIVQAGLLILN